MSTSDNLARAALRGDLELIAELAAGLIRPERNNLVERPWGGASMRSYKGVSGAVESGAWPWGEAFEISAFDDDEEARQYPSRVRLADGSEVDLPALLGAQADALLGEAFVRRYGSRYPLLPKTLSVKELLSVQGHPEGHTEVYIIIDAEPGATLRLGFNRDVDAGKMTRLLEQGIAEQSALLESFGPGFDARELQAVAQSWFADQAASSIAMSDWLDSRLPAAAARSGLERLEGLKALYWQVLDSMNAIEVQPGQVIYNATPERQLLGSGRVASAEVHALGNPEGKEILALEIRLPGPTFRAWDNVRFPQREVDVKAAMAALNLNATRPEDFICELKPQPGRPGTFVSVDCEYFRIEHLRPGPNLSVEVPAAGPHSLHCLEGVVEFFDQSGRLIGRLERGESALVPLGVGDYRIEAALPAHIVRTTLPVD